MQGNCWLFFVPHSALQVLIYYREGLYFFVKFWLWHFFEWDLGENSKTVNESFSVQDSLTTPRYSLYEMMWVESTASVKEKQNVWCHPQLKACNGFENVKVKIWHKNNRPYIWRLFTSNNIYNINIYIIYIIWLEEWIFQGVCFEKCQTLTFDI